MTDDLRAALSAAFENPDPTPAASADMPLDDAPSPVTDAQPTGPARAPDGKFTRPAEVDAPPPPKPADAAPTQAAPAAAPQSQATAPAAPPASWSPAAKAQWAALPDAIRAEIAKREVDFSKGIQQKSLEAKKYEPLEQVIGPRRDVLAAQYGSVENAIGQLFAISDLAAKDPMEFLGWFAQSRGIDLGRIAGAPAQPGQQADPLSPLQQRVDQLEAFIRAQQHQQTQSQQETLVREVERFSSAPENKYFSNVESHMLALIPSVKAMNPTASPQDILKSAYDQAVWANPETRAALQQEMAQQRQAEMAAKAAQKRQAAVSISGSPVAGASHAMPGPSNLRAQLEEAFSVGGRV